MRVVIRTIIDGYVKLTVSHRTAAGTQIEKIELNVHPLVLELTYHRRKLDWLEGKFSVYYASAVALVAGAAGEKQFSDKLVRDPVLVGLRDRVSTVVDKSIQAKCAGCAPCSPGWPPPGQVRRAWRVPASNPICPMLQRNEVSGSG